MSEEQKEVHLRPPGKVNIILKVLDRLPHGYHRLWSLMHTVELEDELIIRLNGHAKKIDLECEATGLPSDTNNLVYRAAELVLSQSGMERGLDIVLRKRIPMGAGLGGGSSDAAATIAGLNRLLGLGWSIDQLKKVGAVLGSDVPFFFESPCAIIRGCGEEVLPIGLGGERWIVLVNPGFPIDTRWAYECLSASRRMVPSLSEKLTSLEVKKGLIWDDVVPLVENDFESPIFQSFETLSRVKRQLFDAGAEASLLSGSGATVFGLFREKSMAVRAQEMVSAVTGYSAYAVKAGSEKLFTTKLEADTSQNFSASRLSG